MVFTNILDIVGTKVAVYTNTFFPNNVAATSVAAPILSNGGGAVALMHNPAASKLHCCC